jgi:hypothetical protein
MGVRLTSGTKAPSRRTPIRPHRLPNRWEVSEEAEAVRTAVRESAKRDEPLHSSIVTHAPAAVAASAGGCDGSIVRSGVPRPASGA